MPYLLRFDGSNDYVSGDSAASVTSATTFSVEIDFALTVAAQSDRKMYRIGNISGSGLLLLVGPQSDGTVRFFARRNENSGFTSLFTGALTSGVRYKVTASINVATGAVSLALGNNAPVTGQIPSYGSTSLSRTRVIGSESSSAGFCQFDLYGIKEFVNGSQISFYDPSGTSSGTTLFDTTGSNNGTLVNFTVPACWVFYSSGGDRNKNYCQFNGTGGFTSPTLGDLITGSPKIKVIIKKLSLTGTDTRPVFWQGGSSPSNRSLVFRRNGNGNYEVFLGGTSTYIFTFSEALAIFGSQTSLACEEFAIEIDGTTARVYKDGSLAITKTGVVRGTSLFSGALFRIGCQAIDDSPTNTTSGTYAPANSTFGDIQVYINDVLVRDYITPSTGTTIPDAVGNNTLTEQGEWPSDNSEWVPVGGGGTSWAGTIGKTSLSSVTKALSINTGQSLSPNKVTLTVSSKQQSISTGFVATNGKTSLTLSPKQEVINVGYINTLSKLGLALLQKQLSITVGANLPFTGVIGKTTYALNGKQFGLALGWSGGVNKRNLSPITKQLNIAAGWNSGVVKSTLPVSNKQESVLAGFVNTINEINIPVNGKPLNLQTGTSISYIGTINKGSLNVSGKPLDVVTGTAIPFVGLMQKTSLTLTGKQLGVVRGQVLDLQKQALNIVGKQLSLGEIVYPIVPIERIFTIKDGDRIHYFKQTTTVYIMKNN